MTRKQVVLPDLQRLVIDYLPGALSELPPALDGLEIVGVKPSDMRSTPYTLVLATGGSGRFNRVLYRAQITLDCYATTAWWAGELARRASAAVLGLPLVDGPVAVVEGSAPAELPDPDSELYRYTVTHQILTRLPGGLIDG